MQNLKVWGIGHSNLSLTDFIGKLKNRQIELVVDTRTSPYSRFCPHFNEKPIREELYKESILYLYRGRNLGGKGENVDYEKTILWLAELAKTKRVAVMCAEKDYTKCHRHKIIAPSLAQLGVDMEPIT
jgi:uncharacterized protein (DUF488 family)